MRIADELEIVKIMIALFCKKKHMSKGNLCDDCRELEAYVEDRLNKCPFRNEKTFCSSCKIHCYNAQAREKIQAVMRFSGPRMILYHPIVAFKHIKETIKNKKRSKEKHG